MSSELIIAGSLVLIAAGALAVRAMLKSRVVEAGTLLALLHEGEEPAAARWATRGVSFRRSLERLGRDHLVAEDDHGGRFVLAGGSGELRHLSATGAKVDAWPSLSHWLASLVEAHAAQTWGPLWARCYDPAAQLDDAAAVALVADARRLFPDLPVLTDARDVVRWAFGEPTVARGLEVFFASCDYDRDLIVEALLEQLSSDERPDEWVLVQSVDDSFWYWDPLRDYPRLLHLRFDDHHQHLRGELVSAGALIAHQLRPRLTAFADPWDLVTAGVRAGLPAARPAVPTRAFPPVRVDALTDRAQRLAAVLPLLAPAVPFQRTLLSELTGVPGVDLRRAAAELEAWGLVRVETLRGREDLLSWEREALRVLATVEALTPSPSAVQTWEALRSSLGKDLQRVRT
jgi:hypothetical protein